MGRDAGWPGEFVTRSHAKAGFRPFVRRFVRTTARTLALLALLMAPVFGQSDPRRRVADRLQGLEREADQLAAESRTLLAELRRLERDRAARMAELSETEGRVAEIQKQLDENTRQIASLEARAVLEEPELAGRLVELYKLGRAGYLRLLFNVDDLRSLGRAYRTTAALAHSDRAQVDRRRALLEALARARAALVDQQRRQQLLYADRAQQRAALDRAVATHNERLAQIDRRRDLNAQLAGELVGVQQKLQRTVGALGSAGGESVHLPIRLFRGGLDWPVAGRIVTGFGRERGRFGTEIVHNGVTIAAREGDPVRALHDGTVGYADLFAGFGNLVILDHGDRAFSLYGRLEALSVKRGDRVDAGQTLGFVGIGPSGEPSLYLELRIDAKPVDPLQWLKRP